MIVDLTRQGLIPRLTDIELTALITARTGLGGTMFMKENPSDNGIYAILSDGTVQSAINTQITTDESGNIFLAKTAGNVAINKATANYPLDVNGTAAFGTNTENTVVVGAGQITNAAGIMSPSYNRILAGYLTTSANTLRFASNGDSSGIYFNTTNSNIGNISSPIARLHIRNLSQLDTVRFSTSEDDSTAFAIDKNGIVKIGTVQPASKNTRVEVYGGIYTDSMYVSGDTTITNSLTVNGEAYIKSKLRVRGGIIGTNAFLYAGSDSYPSWKTTTDLQLMTGLGTENYLVKYNSSGTTGNSVIFQNGNKIGINTNAPNNIFDVKLGTDQRIQFSTDNNGTYLGAAGIISLNDAATAFKPLGFYSTNYYFGLGNLGVGTYNTQAKLHVAGKAIITGNINYNTNSSSGGTNNSIGLLALSNIGNGGYNTVMGAYGLFMLGGGSSGMTAMGYNAGTIGYNGGTPVNKLVGSNSVFLGANTKSLLSTDTTNEIVIGYETIGHGSNTTTIGNNSITDTYISGNLMNSSSGATIGGPSNYWDTIYCTTSAVDLSDARLKTSVRLFTLDELNAAAQLSKEIGTYKFLAAIESKGEQTARRHVGLTVQKAIEIMNNNNLNPFDYGFICYDEWPDVVSGGKVIRKSGNQYSIRYTELLLFVARGFEERLSRLEKNN